MSHTLWKLHSMPPVVTLLTCRSNKVMLVQMLLDPEIDMSQKGMYMAGDESMHDMSLRA